MGAWSSHAASTAILLHRIYVFAISGDDPWPGIRGALCTSTSTSRKCSHSWGICEKERAKCRTHLNKCKSAWRWVCKHCLSIVIPLKQFQGRKAHPYYEQGYNATGHQQQPPEEWTRGRELKCSHNWFDFRFQLFIFSVCATSRV
jgi:hypothetical protein